MTPDELRTHLSAIEDRETFGVDRIGAVAVGPERVLFHWELTGGGVERAAQAGPGRVVIEVVPTEAVPPRFAGDAEGPSGWGWYAVPAGKSARFRLVWDADDGSRRVLAASPPVGTPWEVPEQAPGATDADRGIGAARLSGSASPEHGPPWGGTGEYPPVLGPRPTPEDPS